MDTETFDERALIPAILSEFKRIYAPAIPEQPLISLESAYQNFRPEYDDYGDALLAQEPLNDISKLPADEPNPNQLTTESEPNEY